LLPCLCAVSLRAQAGSPVLPARRTVAGVTILEHDASAFERAPKWSISATPVATAGGGNARSAFDLTDVYDAALLSDGRLFTVASGSKMLLFGVDGRGEKVVGRPGKGPGDFTLILGFARHGDTLLIPDPSNNRLNYVVASRGVIAMKPLPARPRPPFSNYNSVGALRNGELVILPNVLMPLPRGTRPDSVIRQPMPMFRLSADASTLRPVAELPGTETIVSRTRYRGTPGTQTTAVKFGVRPSAIAWDTVIATGSGDTYQLDLRAPTGAIVSSLRVARLTRRPVTKAMRDSVIVAYIRNLEGHLPERLFDKAETIRLTRTQPFADSLPAYGAWFTTPDKTLWVTDSRTDFDPGGSATAFRQDGAILGRLAWRGAGVPLAFDDTHVVLKVVDDDGLVSLEIHRIIR
jgi:hypothetical protein